MNRNSQQANAVQPGLAALQAHIVQNKINATLWCCRVATLFFTLVYLLFGNSYNSYSKVLLAGAATSALRLHQRIPNVRLSYDFLKMLIMEDSFHYLFYSLVFFYVRPSLLPLLPVCLFAILHTASYSLTYLDLLGQNSWWAARLMISLVELQSRNIFRLISFIEIVLLPYLVVFVYLGKCSLITPILYYHILVQRYVSRRNPHTQNMFRELRVIVEQHARKPNYPTFIKNALLMTIRVVTWLGPPQIVHEAQQ